MELKCFANIRLNSESLKILSENGDFVVYGCEIKKNSKKTDKKTIERWSIEFSFLNLQTEKSGNKY